METIDIFILSLFHHGYKVRRSTLTHLLVGKRTTSILIYGFFYQLLPYFSLFSKWRGSEFDKHLEVLLSAELLSETPDQLLELTPKGQALLAQHSYLPTTHLDGLRYGRIDLEFFELLLFASQVVSEYVHGNTSYYPIEKNPAKQYQLKQWLKTVPAEKNVIGRGFFNEWHQLLLELPLGLRDSFINLLSGHQQIGQTFSQLQSEHYPSHFERALLQKNNCHLFLKIVAENKQELPYFYSLYQLLAERTVNESAERSYALFRSHLSLSEIATRRHLKVSTVTDHLIEAAILDKDFPFARVLTETDVAILTEFAKKEPMIRSWRFSQLLTACPDVSFLTFRCFQIKQIRGEAND